MRKRLVRKLDLEKAIQKLSITRCLRLISSNTQYLRKSLRESLI